MRPLLPAWLRAAALYAVFFSTANGQTTLSEATNISVDAAADGQLVTDILGGLWLLSERGGDAVALTGASPPVRRPRWSPQDSQMVYETIDAGGYRNSRIGLYDITSRKTRLLGEPRFADRHPDWHPHGERVVFSSERRQTGFDIWEIDIDTGLTFRLTNLPGNESEPVWSADGRSLLYVYESGGIWSLMLRRRGAADEALTQSSSPILAPSWRPDGSLVTYLKQTDGNWQVWMSVLSEPRLHRVMISDEDFFHAPISWLDRLRMVYTANGRIRSRHFNSWTSRDLPFRARIDTRGESSAVTVASRNLPELEEPAGKLVIRAGRLFDGVSDAYLSNRDILIAGGQITSIEPQHKDNAEGAIVVDLGDVTVLPGYVDAYAQLPVGLTAEHGPLLLSLGITSLVGKHAKLRELNELWAGKEIPGPRLLRALSIRELGLDGSRPDIGKQPPDDDKLPWLVTIAGDLSIAGTHRDTVRKLRERGVAVLANSWQAGVGAGASLIMGTDNRPSSPGGRHYQDRQLVNAAGTMQFLSGLADAATPGITDIFSTRQGRRFGSEPALPRRHAVTPRLRGNATAMVLSSYANGVPAGPALHAEFRALVAAGLNEAQALRAAGVNAASALGVSLKLGRIAPGAAADLVVVDGNPLNDINDSLKITGVVRNGRFYSVSGLLERVTPAQNVE